MSKPLLRNGNWTTEKGCDMSQTSEFATDNCLSAMLDMLIKHHKFFSSHFLLNRYETQIYLCADGEIDYHEQIVQTVTSGQGKTVLLANDLMGYMING